MVSKRYIGTVNDYQRPRLFVSPHLETIYPALFRRVPDVHYDRERISTPDNDFLDLDWIRNDQKKLVIISHGLEGDSQRPYVRGMARTFSAEGYDVLAWNFRGCSGEINRQLRFYHSGATDDLSLVINHALETGYKEISLIGFSLGGNMTLRYLGELTNNPGITRAVAISVPLHLHSSCLQISQPGNFIYSRRFLRNLCDKIRRKARVMPDKLDTRPLGRINSLIEFDDTYTAPIHGFRDAVDYYEQCSALYVLDKIKVPTLILNAANDPFLSPRCYPSEEFEDHAFVNFEIPEYGGHVGFVTFNQEKRYWSEIRSLRFINRGD